MILCFQLTQVFLDLPRQPPTWHERGRGWGRGRVSWSCWCGGVRGTDTGLTGGNFIQNIQGYVCRLDRLHTRSSPYNLQPSPAIFTQFSLIHNNFSWWNKPKVLTSKICWHEVSQRSEPQHKDEYSDIRCHPASCLFCKFLPEHTESHFIDDRRR